MRQAGVLRESFREKEKKKEKKPLSLTGRKDNCKGNGNSGWGSCNYRAGTIRLNTELAKKPKECLEYVVVHEMVHLIEPTHNPRFISIMDRFMPNWQLRRDQLNRLPVRHEEWAL